MNNKQWWVYMVRCADNSLYTGITTNVPRRVQEHNAKNGAAAKYTRSRQPVRLAYQEPVPTRSAATRREGEIRRLKKPGKESLISRSKYDS